MPNAWQRFFCLPFSVRLAWAFWLILIVTVSIRVAVSKPTSQTVLPIYLHAGERWLAEKCLYAPILWEDLFRNPPVVALGFAGLTYLPEKLAGLLLRLGSIALFLTGMWRVRQTLLPEWSVNRVGWWFFIAAILVIPSFNNGQLNILIAAGALHGVVAVIQKRYTEAAFWLGGIGWLKLYPIAVGLLVVLVAPPKFTLRLFLVGLLGALLPFAFHSQEYVFQEYECFIHYMREDNRNLAHESRMPRDWTTIPRALLGYPPSTTTIQAVSLGMAMVCAGWVLWRRHRQPHLAILVLSHTWMTAFGPATESVSYSLLAATAPLVLLRPGQPRWEQALAGVGVFLLLDVILRGMFPNDQALTLLGVQPLGALLICLSYLLSLPENAASPRPEVRAIS
jgi:Glycosyltransferase family 87